MDDIIRVEQDGVEFFTVNKNGRCGTSISGGARLNGVAQQSVSELIQNVGTGKVKSECLKPFLGKDVRVQFRFKKIGSFTQITWIDSDFVAAMTEYYAFESPRKKEKALFTYRKFAKMGIERWIHGITGWKPPEIKTPEEPEILLPDLNFSRSLIQTLTQNQLSPTAYRLCLHLHKVGQLGERPTVAKLCKDLEISRPTFHKTIRCLNDLGVLPDWFEIETRNYPERIVRDWLHSELGGQIEAPTPYGPIDLLTDDSVIEVKAAENWKEAIGHVLVKGLKYPDHAPCLMLFSDRIRNFQPIRECCEAFEIILGFQLIKYIYDETDELLEIECAQVFL